MVKRVADVHGELRFVVHYQKLPNGNQAARALVQYAAPAHATVGELQPQLGEMGITAVAPVDVFSDAIQVYASLAVKR